MNEQPRQHYFQRIIKDHTVTVQVPGATFSRFSSSECANEITGTICALLDKYAVINRHY